MFLDNVVFIDSHCHLNYGEIAADLPGVLQRAKDAGVEKMLCINTKIQEFEDVYSIANNYSNIFATAGVHPHESGDTVHHSTPDNVRAFLEVASLRNKVVGLGETGLDYYYNHSPRDVQISMFDTHMQVAVAHDLPVIVHTRDSEEDTLAVLQKFAGRARGVIHCFSGTQNLANAVLDLGFYISVSGIVTFKKAEDIRSVLRTVPLDRLLIETDAPYLAPVPFRGRSNEPSYVVHTAEELAHIKGVSTAEIAKKTTENFHSLFTRVPR
ncbi:MAG: TatD family hydrolase [Alphaproteobacteria bacterium]|nr:MAG: TatD family hydrolase [Alphaproteobacteria bacterium]